MNRENETSFFSRLSNDEDIKKSLENYNSWLKKSKEKKRKPEVARLYPLNLNKENFLKKQPENKKISRVTEVIQTEPIFFERTIEEINNNKKIKGLTTFKYRFEDQYFDPNRHFIIPQIKVSFNYECDNQPKYLTDIHAHDTRVLFEMYQGCEIFGCVYDKYGKLSSFGFVADNMSNFVKGTKKDAVNFICALPYDENIEVISYRRKNMGFSTHPNLFKENFDNTKIPGFPEEIGKKRMYDRPGNQGVQNRCVVDYDDLIQIGNQVIKIGRKNADFLVKNHFVSTSTFGRTRDMEIKIPGYIDKNKIRRLSEAPQEEFEQTESLFPFSFSSPKLGIIIGMR